MPRKRTYRRAGTPIGAGLIRVMETLEKLGGGDFNEVWPHLTDVPSAETVRRRLCRAHEYGFAEKLGGWPARYRPKPGWRETLAQRMAPPPRIGRVNSVWQLAQGTP